MKNQESNDYLIIRWKDFFRSRSMKRHYICIAVLIAVIIYGLTYWNDIIAFETSNKFLTIQVTDKYEELELKSKRHMKTERYLFGENEWGLFTINVSRRTYLSNNIGSTVTFSDLSSHEILRYADTKRTKENYLNTLPPSQRILYKVDNVPLILSLLFFLVGLGYCLIIMFNEVARIRIDNIWVVNNCYGRSEYCSSYKERPVWEINVLEVILLLIAIISLFL